MIPALLLTATGLLAPVQDFTESHVELLIALGDPVAIDDPLGAPWRWILPGEIRNVADGGWLQEGYAIDDTGRSEFLIVGQRPGAIDGPVEVLAGPDLLNGRSLRDYDLAGAHEGWITGPSGPGASDEMWLDGQLVLRAGDDVVGSGGWTWMRFDKVHVSTGGRALILGRAIEPTTGGEYILALDHTAGRVLFDGWNFFPGMNRRIDRLSIGDRIALSDEGEHWAVNVIFRGNPILSAILADDQVYEFEPGYRAVRSEPVTPGIAAATEGHSWAFFDQIFVNDRGDLATVALVAGAPVDKQAALIRNGRALSVRKQFRVHQLSVDGAMTTTEGDYPGPRFAEGHELYSRADAEGLPLDVDRDGVPDAGWSYRLWVLGAASSTGKWTVMEGYASLEGTAGSVHGTARVRDYRLDESICTGAPNSTGRPGELMLVGDSVAADNDAAVEVYGLPVARPGYLLLSRSAGTPVTPPGSQGQFCLGGAVGRLQSQLFVSQVNGRASVPLDLTSLPQPTGPVSAMAGETWYAQAWHRDTSAGSATSNFTSATEVTFR